jgi:hypothetical protein
MLQPKKSAGLDLLNKTIQQKRKEFSPEVIDNDLSPTSTLSQEELVSRDMSLGNVSAATLDLLYTSPTEKETIEF